MGYWLGTLCFFAIQVIVTLCINAFSKRSSKGWVPGAGDAVMGAGAGFEHLGRGKRGCSALDAPRRAVARRTHRTAASVRPRCALPVPTTAPSWHPARMPHRLQHILAITSIVQCWFM